SQATKVAGREPVRLHPSTAADRDIKNGDVVRIFNDRGACLAGAVLDNSLMPEVIQLSTGAWYDPDEDGTCRAGNPNVLTRDKGTSELAQGPSAHTCLVDVELLAGDAPTVEVYKMPSFTEIPKDLI
ncbi:MAG: biotin/methionine sulfoxide reductase, partial [Candidatus Poriferisodalaceae bacterium]